MKISELCDLFDTPSRRKAIDGLAGNKKIKRAAIDGLAGSSPAMLFSRLPEKHSPYLIVANDLDEAGYMYNDLCRINGDKDVLLFPSGYKIRTGRPSITNSQSGSAQPLGRQAFALGGDLSGSPRRKSSVERKNQI